MNIAIIGYGKMGKAIEKVALDRDHKISTIIDSSDFNIDQLEGSDVAIEFTQPDAAFSNILKCISAKVPVVVGTTGWYNHYDELVKSTIKNGSALFTATNFSIGVNILFHVNKKLADIMNGFEEYEVRMDETHHIQKKDHPSGTAATLAEGIINSLDRKKKYVGLLEDQQMDTSPFDLQIVSKRENEVPGYHQVTYSSNIDEIKISHNAKNRQGFAIGSVIAAEWLKGKHGVFGMKDLLNFEK